MEEKKNVGLESSVAIIQTNQKERKGVRGKGKLSGVTQCHPSVPDELQVSLTANFHVYEEAQANELSDTHDGRL